MVGPRLLAIVQYSTQCLRSRYVSTDLVLLVSHTCSHRRSHPVLCKTVHGRLLLLASFGLRSLEQQKTYTYHNHSISFCRSLSEIFSNFNIHPKLYTVMAIATPNDFLTNMPKTDDLFWAGTFFAFYCRGLLFRRNREPAVAYAD